MYSTETLAMALINLGTLSFLGWLFRGLALLLLYYIGRQAMRAGETSSSAISKPISTKPEPQPGFLPIDIQQAAMNSKGNGKVKYHQSD